jgi:hypothetical protein
MTTQIIPLKEPSLRDLLLYLDTNTISIKQKLTEQVDEIPDLKKIYDDFQKSLISIDEAYMEAQQYIDNPFYERALDIWFDYHRSCEYCTAQWKEWETYAKKNGSINRINLLGLWQICASPPISEIKNIPILLHTDRLILHLIHLIDEAVDSRISDKICFQEYKVKGIIHSLRLICEINSPGSRDKVSRYYQHTENEYFSHQSHFQPNRSLVDQLYHKMIPNKITSQLYNDIMYIIIGNKFDMEKAKRATQEAMYVWQIMDDVADCTQDICEGVANVILMCLDQSGEHLPQNMPWPTPDRFANLLPKTLILVRRIFEMICQWLKINRPDVLKFLFNEFKRVFPDEWHYIFNNGKTLEK